MPDNLDELLSAGSMLNPITPAIDLIKDFTRGPNKHFYIDAYAGHSVNDVKRALKRRGVEFWNAKFLDDMIVFTVRRRDTDAARIALETANVNIIW